jgi:hypothetical protein
MPPKTNCGCGGGFGGRHSAFGSTADSFFYGLNKGHIAGCLQNEGYYRNNSAPLSRASGFGSKTGHGPMKIGTKKR